MSELNSILSEFFHYVQMYGMAVYFILTLSASLAIASVVGSIISLKNESRQGRKHILSIFGLVLGILGIIIPVFIGIVAFVFTLFSIRKDEEHRKTILYIVIPLLVTIIFTVCANFALKSVLNQVQEETAEGITDFVNNAGDLFNQAYEQYSLSESDQDGEHEVTLGSSTNAQGDTDITLQESYSDGQGAVGYEMEGSMNIEPEAQTGLDDMAAGLDDLTAGLDDLTAGLDDLPLDVNDLGSTDNQDMTAGMDTANNQAMSPEPGTDVQTADTGSTENTQTASVSGTENADSADTSSETPDGFTSLDPTTCIKLVYAMSGNSDIMSQINNMTEAFNKGDYKFYQDYNAYAYRLYNKTADGKPVVIVAIAAESPDADEFVILGTPTISEG